MLNIRLYNMFEYIKDDMLYSLKRSRSNSGSGSM